MKKNTKQTCPKVGKLLNELNNNLSGKHGDYWLKALEKMLRKQRLPVPPAELIKIVDRSTIQKNIIGKRDLLVAYLKSIPVVHDVTIPSKEFKNSLLDIEVCPNFSCFLDPDKDHKGDSACFDLRMDGEVLLVNRDCKIFDSTFERRFKRWFKLEKKNKNNFRLFLKALIELGEHYKVAVPNID